VLVVRVPFLNDGFGTVVLSPVEWLLGAAIASSVPWVDEVRKLVVRRG
jgi:Ca2+-transporting ATPase